MRLALQLQVPPESLAALPSGAQSQQCHAVQCPGQQSLSEVGQRWKRNMVCMQARHVG